MGLSAGQARLLTITARKSNCEYQSMQYSHQKLAISRGLEDISNEYQNSLEQTKLIYDYYGTGTCNTQLSYGILMNPSELNNYMPNLLTNSSGRVVLDSKYAAAAKAAGIPKEGLEGLPSQVVRNKFIQALADNDIITQARADKFMTTSYNQLASLGAVTTQTITTSELNYSELVEMLTSQDYTVDPTDTMFNNDYVKGVVLYNDDVPTLASGDDTNDWIKQNPSVNSSRVTLGEILTGNYVLAVDGRDEWNGAFVDPGGAVDAMCNSSFWTDMFDTIENLLDVGDPYTQDALAYARDQIEYMITNMAEPNEYTPKSGMEHGKRWPDDVARHPNFAAWTSWYKAYDRQVRAKGLEQASNNNNGYVGMCGVFNTDTGHDDRSDMSRASINLSNMFRAYLTFFAQKMEGLAISDYSVGLTKALSNFVGDEFTFNIFAGSDLTEDEMRLVNFYDTLLNQLCTRGWTENENINDNQYMQEMLQNGMMFLTKIKDDGYYYQGNYATDSYIKTVEDETAIAQAEAKYQTEKERLTRKENTIDLKMKNLDTEISSLTTEYDTVKNTITKNIERTFKRYNA